jgi:hypothetical protein
MPSALLFLQSDEARGFILAAERSKQCVYTDNANRHRSCYLTSRTYTYSRSTFCLAIWKECTACRKCEMAGSESDAQAGKVLTILRFFVQLLVVVGRSSRSWQV